MAVVRFDVARDAAEIRQGGFFCRACLTGQPSRKASPRDSRYCRSCQPIILAEYTTIAKRRGKPLSTVHRPVKPPAQALGTQSDLATCSATCQEEPTNLAPCGRRSTYRKRPLPEDRILKMANAGGMGCKGITRALAEEGVKLSCRTVARIINGTRRQPEVAVEVEAS